MKFINLATLLQQNQGVLFADYTPGNIGHLRVFGGRNRPESIDYVSADFGVPVPLLPDEFDCWTAFIMDHMTKGVEAPIDTECWGRNGRFDEKEMFVLLDKNDVQLLLKQITLSLAVGYSEPPASFEKKIVSFEKGMTVTELKAIVKDWPEKNASVNQLKLVH